MRGLSGIAVTLAIGYALICLLMWFGQRWLIYFPQPRQSHVPAMVIESHGERLVVSTRPADGGDAVIYFGGNAEDVTWSLPELGRAFPSHALYLMHYRGYGGSTGQPSEAGLVRDGLTLFDHVHRDHARIVIVGRSLGSGVAVQVASQRPVSRLVLVTPYDSLLALARDRYPWLPVGWLLRDPFDSARVAHRIEAPTLIVVAERDDVVPVASSRALLSRFAPGVATLAQLRGTDHGSISSSVEYAPLIGGRTARPR